MANVPPAQPVPLPAPWGGVNTRDGIAALQPYEAREMWNFEPSGSAVKPRPGNADYSTGAAAAPVETLAAYHGLTASALIGVCSGSIYDFSSAVASVLSAAGYTKSRFQTECYNNRLIGVNGVDTPWTYNGAAIVATGFTGPTLTTLANIKKVRNRLWFAVNNSADAYYGGLGSITGALTLFSLSQVVGGGTLMAVGAHSQDAGDGPDDLTVFVMSTGEFVVYSGDPSTTFSKVGNFLIPARPIGRDCLWNLGGALHVITEMGVVPISVAMTTSTLDFVALGNFGKIGPTFKRYADLYSTNAGWFMRTWGGRLIVNVPVLDGADSIQEVMNTLVQGGAWTGWNGFNAASMCEWDGDLYFGMWTEGTVRQVTGYTDDTGAIALSVRQAFSALGSGMQTRATAIRFDIQVDGAFSGAFGIDSDYISAAITTPSVTIVSSTATTNWGAAWGSAWSTSTQVRGAWFGCWGEGRALGLAMDATTTAPGLSWAGWQLLVQQIGPGV